MVPRGSSAPLAGLGLTLDLCPCFMVFKNCNCFSPLNKHYMVVINTSLGEGQGFKIENNFHKNIKNGKKVILKNLLYKLNGSC